MKCFSSRPPFLRLVLLLGLWSAALIATTQAQQQRTILDFVKGTSSLSGLAVAVQKADAAVASTLSSSGPFTLFAPTDAAFANLPVGVVDYLLANPKVLTDVLLYHVVRGSIYSEDISAQRQFINTLLPNETLLIRRRRYFTGIFTGFSREVRVNGASVIQADYATSNGVVHIINHVLIPPDLMIPMDLFDTVVDAELSTLAKALIRADLVPALRAPNTTFTVFAPTDAAFATLPTGVVEYLLRDKNKATLQDVLKYHVVPGTIDAGAILNGTVTTAQTLSVNKTLSFAVVNGSTVSINAGAAKVVQPNVRATNGIAHVIDKVLVPPGITLPPTLLDLGKAVPDFSTLLSALQAAGLDTVLAGPGPYTVFAPTNAAFAALPNGTLTTLLADPKGQLANVLKYHIMEGEVPAAEAIRLAGGGGSIKMLNGQAVKLSLVNGTILTLNNGTSVVTPDTFALNGVVHVIDKVLIPDAAANKPPAGQSCKVWPWVCDFISIFA